MTTSDSHRTAPQYVRIAAEIRDQVRAGVLRPGAPVPSAQGICDTYGVSMITAKNALNLLKSEGVVYGIAGKGTFVAENPRLTRTAPHRYFQRRERTYVQETERAGLTSHVEHNTSVIQATEWIARRLDIEPGEEVVATAYLISADHGPLSKSLSWEPLRITGGTVIERPHEGPHAKDGLNARFAAIGWTVDQVEEHLVIRKPDPVESKVLAIPDDVPVVEIRQTVRAVQAGRDDLIPVEAADIIFPTDRWEFRYLMDRPH